MSNGDKARATSCPNCLNPAMRLGNEVTCEKCDAVFVITKKQGAKVKELGPIDEIKQRVTRLEQYHTEPQETKPEVEQEESVEEDDL